MYTLLDKSPLYITDTFSFPQIINEHSKTKRGGMCIERAAAHARYTLAACGGVAPRCWHTKLHSALSARQEEDLVNSVFKNLNLVSWILVPTWPRLLVSFYLSREDNGLGPFQSEARA